MDTKSTNINEESIFQEEIKKSNKRKSKSGNIFKKYIVVLLTFISIACAILSLREIKANIRYIIPGGIYLNGDLSAENQEKVADAYVAGRYGSWSAAKTFWLANGWY